MQPQPQTLSSKKAKRRLFTRDAQFSLQRFDASATPGADGTSAQPPKPGVIATLTGRPILWNVLSDDRGGYKVRFLPKSVNFPDATMALFHHNFAAIIGNTDNDTLRITVDDVGVKVEIDIPDTSTGNDVAELVAKKYVKGMSFSMLDPDYDMVTENDQKIMNVSSFTCDEVTVTGIPSFTETSIDVSQDNRMADEEEEEEDDEEDSPATADTASAKKGDDEEDDDDEEDLARQQHSKDTPNRNLQNLKLQKYKFDQLTL